MTDAAERGRDGERHRPRKRFGQHFLRDPAVIDRIIALIDPQVGERLVEIGPGLGALTEPLLDSGAYLDVFEIDRDLAAGLGADPACDDGRLRVHCGDILRCQWVQHLGLTAQQRVRIVGNLPYCISTPLLFHLLKDRRHIESMVLMLQREVVDRMAAAAATAAYGRLSVMVQYYCEVLPLLRVGAQVFHPVPKVDSGVVRLRPRRQHTSMPLAEDESGFARLVAAAFGQRRKTLRNALRELATEAQLIAAGINPQQRPQTLTVPQFVHLSNRIFCVTERT